jgi:PHD/YefM family antitoxin component YafN of YafNO toxin-antitoxin module
MRVTIADFSRNHEAHFGYVLNEPIWISLHGSDAFVMVTAAEYDRLKRRDRRAVGIEEMTDEELHLIATAEIPVECFAHDGELEDWTP